MEDRSNGTSDLEELARQERELADRLAVIQAEKIKAEEAAKTRVNGHNGVEKTQVKCPKCGGDPLEGCENGVKKALHKGDEFKGSWLVCERLKDEDTFFDPSPHEKELPKPRPVVSWLAYAESLDGKKRE